MASRRDELNAYTFAKRRLIAQFLQPNPTGSEEGALRPLRAVVPGAVIAVVVLAVFGAWGMFKPVAPKKWDTPKEHVIIASKSTTRYVVLETDGKKQLHPVLNMASAKLLLAPDKGTVVNVGESVLDNGEIPHGATLGIPYAPDRLPDAQEAGAAKRWAVCERPGEGGRAIQKATFVFAEREKKKTEGKNALRGGELMYVEGPDRARYIVDGAGKAYPVGKDELLLRTLVAQNPKPQRVSAAWLATLHTGDPITFPTVDGVPGAPAGAPGTLGERTNRVGMVLTATAGTRTQSYVVLPGRVAPVSDFTAKLLLSSRQLVDLRQAGNAQAVSAAELEPGAPFNQERDWPVSRPEPVNSPDVKKGSRNTVCNVLRGVDADSGATTLSTWAGTSFPATLPTGSSSAYVTPGSGQFFRQFKGSTTSAGFLFLVTDTGLRYAMQSNSDSGQDRRSGIGESGDKEEGAEQQEEAQQAQNRLGYKDVDPSPVPAAWSALLPTGPRLSTGSASQPQGS
ncbi:type VII secretion protein EccB [Streptomyces californicus]|uniref:Type VII secretion protein EccB n=1 Tax=Streptomyces californicus TaxID=67351 RepID=A0ABD7CXW4_9ACTN|nr:MULTISPECIES: type VII secretion protein EccB [Streptomyces]QRV30532.1 type VII secretion protein EccB [Streptomyces californicus]QRV33859.1 type VII secretion protein EccB [Streptomyces californicus]QRV43946.1 type VII secretion protein EccB [Streptomyces californicus]QRV50635.1 type VII secretion protein EccB [Streptomyces californicus]